MNQAKKAKGHQVGETPQRQASIGVQLAGDTSVKFTLAAESVGGNRHERYTHRGAPSHPGGPMIGDRGNLRNSDAASSPQLAGTF